TCRCRRTSRADAGASPRQLSPLRATRGFAVRRSWRDLSWRACSFRLQAEGAQCLGETCSFRLQAEGAQCLEETRSFRRQAVFERLVASAVRRAWRDL